MITKELKEKILNNIIQTDNGCCYKDFDAWNNNNGVIYVSEYEIEDIEEDVDIDVFTYTKLRYPFSDIIFFYAIPDYIHHEVLTYILEF